MAFRQVGSKTIHICWFSVLLQTRQGMPRAELRCVLVLF